MKRNILSQGIWWLLLLGPLCLRIDATEPPLKIEKSITFITEPLDEEGLPDYFEFVRQQSKAGVTPDNNAVVLLWQALGPSEIDEEHRPAFFAELNMPVPPEKGQYLIELADERMEEAGIAWLEKIDWKPASGIINEEAQEENQANDGKGNEWDEFFEEREEDAFGFDDRVWELESARRHQVGKLCDAAAIRPWKESDFPPLAAWLRANKQPLDLAVEASLRPKFYEPMVARILEAGPPLLMHDRVTVQWLRGIARGLCLRATLHTGEGRFAEAHADLMACRRLARYAGQQFGIISSLVAVAMETISDKAHVALLQQMSQHKDAVPQGLYRQMLVDLQSLPPAKEMRQVNTYDERVLMLDNVVQMIRRTDDPKDRSWIHNRAVYDWNYILRQFNDDFDLYKKAAYEDDPDQRAELFEQLNERIEAWEDAVQSKTLFAKGLLSLEARSKQQYARTANLLWSPSQTALEAERRGITQRRLSIVTTALAAFHARRGEYPVELRELSPVFLKELPLDPVYEEKFRYFRQRKGYLLYGLGMNAKDDHGTFRDLYEDQPHYVIQGEWMTHDALQAKLDNLSETDRTGESEEWEKYEGDDLVIRLPLPEFDWPKAK